MSKRSVIAGEHNWRRGQLAFMRKLVKNFSYDRQDQFMSLIAEELEEQKIEYEAALRRARNKP